MKESYEARNGILPGRVGDVFVPNCPSRVLLDHVTSRWGVLVLIALSAGTMRWSEIRRLLQGVTEKMLAQTLHTLEADRLVLREAHPVIPPRVDYSLTSRGREVAALLQPLVEWVSVNTAGAAEAG
jgi:DNA-binding HxlR family transcriptional regulator